MILLCVIQVVIFFLWGLTIFLLERTDKQLTKANEILKRLAGYGPDHLKKATHMCWFCDLGDAGYSTQGPGYHDDKDSRGPCIPGYQDDKDSRGPCIAMGAQKYIDQYLPKVKKTWREADQNSGS
jgi:hypothetical protein